MLYNSYPKDDHVAFLKPAATLKEERHPKMKHVAPGVDQLIGRFWPAMRMQSLDFSLILMNSLFVDPTLSTFHERSHSLLIFN